MNIIDGQITKNFKIQEMVCRDGSLLINVDVIRQLKMLQEFRDWYNRPMHINSGYRSPSYNKKIGGAKHSQHMLGTATDIALPKDYHTYSTDRKRQFIDNCKNKWFEICDKYNVDGGFGEYKTFIHMDSRVGKRATWKG
ncbi:MAG: D-Ala-D-Ala carboxypeptidase family metallohydrolase [Tepidibacter sp.]|jgi:uncharacterized protein YcbK (DUF882 family)|uniref:YcbK family protein n=1 Tax=Tepidibacter sp. TaxID=2529387 RepID=UPI0025CB9D46|nr:D-Ala-D-Ala carboxypeptidase family metallohydrolase [Tepidibacter sp.]MCT4508263.1 D-Ala-D-Ala carboxypeptidase family metallohydrolase [Tepidibacter sp.]